MQERLEVIIIPMASAYMVLPAKMVLQVFPRAPLIPTESVSSYIQGTLIVQQYKLEVLNLASAFKEPSETMQQESDKGSAKFIWIAALGKNAPRTGYVLESTQTPIFMTCYAKDIRYVRGSDHDMVANYVDVNGLDNPNKLPVFIPDILSIESEL